MSCICGDCCDDEVADGSAGTGGGRAGLEGIGEVVDDCWEPQCCASAGVPPKSEDGLVRNFLDWAGAARSCPSSFFFEVYALAPVRVGLTSI